MKFRNAIRVFEDGVEIDVKKGSWPYIRAQKFDDRLMMMIDCNEGGQIVGEGQGVAAIGLSRKKVTALRDYLNRFLEETA